MWIKRATRFVMKGGQVPTVVSLFAKITAMTMGCAIKVLVCVRTINGLGKLAMFKSARITAIALMESARKQDYVFVERGFQERTVHISFARITAVEKENVIKENVNVFQINRGSTAHNKPARGTAHQTVSALMEFVTVDLVSLGNPVRKKIVLIVALIMEYVKVITNASALLVGMGRTARFHSAPINVTEMDIV